MTFESVKIFCDVVRQRSFSRGAAMNNVSQSAASQAISQIEKRLGVQLIDRSKRPFTLTPAGRSYFEGCRELVDRYFRVEAETQSLHNGGLSNLLVASIFSVGLYNMNQYVRRFNERFPNGTVRIDYLHPSRVFERVLTEESDIGILSFPRVRREIEAALWREEPMVLVCPPSHRFVENERIRLAELDREDFVAFEADLAIRRHVDRYLRTSGLAVCITMEFDNIEAIKRAVEIGAGVSILPEPTVRSELASGALASVPVEGLDLVRPLSIIRRRGRVLTPAIACFLEVLRGDSMICTPTIQGRELAAAAGGPDGLN
jgi:DNA-binding transcriptional LysR family regulator